MSNIKIKIKDIATVKNGSTPSTSNTEFYDGEIIWITPKDLSTQNNRYIKKGERTITKAGFDSCSAAMVPKGTILLSSRAPIGLLSIAGTDLCTNQGFKNIIPDKTKIDSEYLYYYLKIKIADIDKLGSGTTFKEVSKSSIENFHVLIPSKVEYQQKIASVLSALDSKIELNNRINAELEAMAKTLYDYWFVQFDFPNEKGKPYRTSGGKMVWNDELKREVPEGWSSTYVGNILMQETTTKKIPTSEIYTKGNTPVIDQSTDYIAGFTNDEDSIIKTNEPRIIFGDHTRILKLINFDFARGADGTQVLLSSSKKMPQHLFYHTLLKIDLSNYGYARHFKFLKETKIILPNESIAQRFENIIKCNYLMIKDNIFQNQKLSELRDWLLPMLMNGQVKVE